MKFFGMTKESYFLRAILSALTVAPLYFLVEIDLGAMFGSTDPKKLKAGDIIRTEKRYECISAQ